MPWTPADADSHKKGLTDAQQEKWAATANSARATCIEDGGDAEECDAQAIRIANGTVEEVGMGEVKETATNSVSGSDMPEPGSRTNAVLAGLERELPEPAIGDVGEMYDNEDVEHQAQYAAPMSAMSFADVDAAAGAQESMDNVRTRMGQFNALMDNVMWSEGVSNKAAALRGLTEEFIALLPGSLEIAAEAAAVNEESEECALAETYAGVEMLTEGIAEVDAQGPLTMKIRPIRPGFGNAKDGHYYSAAMLKRDAGVLVGAKMYETDHKSKEKSTRTWVSTVTDLLGFDNIGAPICEVVVHDPGFAQRVRNLKEADLLDKLECSILGDGKVKRGTIDGKKAKIVEALTKISSVDWVTRAGAGGKALAISESDDGSETMTEEKQEEVLDEKIKEQEEQTQEQEKQEEQTEGLGASVVLKALLNSDLPRAAQERLAEADYAAAEDLAAAIAVEKEYVTKLREAASGGRPFAMGETATPKVTDERPLAEREQAIIQKYRGG